MPTEASVTKSTLDVVQELRDQEAGVALTPVCDIVQPMSVLVASLHVVVREQGARIHGLVQGAVWSGSP